MLISAATMLAIGYLVKVKKISWLENYAMPISMLTSMILAIPITAVMGGN